MRGRAWWVPIGSPLQGAWGCWQKAALQWAPNTCVRDPALSAPSSPSPGSFVYCVTEASQESGFFDGLAKVWAGPFLRLACVSVR